MKKAIIIEYDPAEQDLIDQALNRLAAAGVRVTTGSTTNTNGQHIAPHFHYLCRHCGWAQITVGSYNACPKCASDIEVGAEGVVTTQVRIPTFVQNLGMIQ